MLSQSETAPRLSPLRESGRAIEAAIAHHEGAKWRDVISRDTSEGRAREALAALALAHRDAPGAVCDLVRAALSLLGECERDERAYARGATAYAEARATVARAYDLVPHAPALVRSPSAVVTPGGYCMPSRVLLAGLATAPEYPREPGPRTRKGSKAPIDPASLPKQIGAWEVLGVHDAHSVVIRCKTCGIKETRLWAACRLSHQSKGCNLCAQRARNARNKIWREKVSAEAKAEKRATTAKQGPPAPVRVAK